MMLRGVPLLLAVPLLSACAGRTALHAWSRESEGPLTGGGSSPRVSSSEGAAEYAWDRNGKKVNLTLEGHAWLSVFGDVDQWDAWAITTDEFYIGSKELGAIRVKGIRTERPETFVLLRLWKGPEAPVLAATLRGFSRDMEIEIPQHGGRKPTPEEEAWLRKLIVLGKHGRDPGPPPKNNPRNVTTSGIIFMAIHGLKKRFAEGGAYPDSGHENLFTALSEESKDRSRYCRPLEKSIQNEKIMDAFGRPLVYRKLSELRFQLYSLGEDGKDQGGHWDDVASDP